VRLVLWHGYLLWGTGSNVYTRQLARALSGMGEQVTVVCQDRDPTRTPAGVKLVCPDIGSLLPVFVEDHYPGLVARRLGDCTDDQLRRFRDANAAAVRREVGRGEALVVANHALMGGPVAAAACQDSDVPYAVYVHGSELEYAIRGNPRLAAMAAPCLDGAAAVFCGSRHIVSATAEVIGPGAYLERTHIVPPGVDTDLFTPQGGSLPRLLGLLGQHPGGGERDPDHDAAERLAGLGRFIVYVGKLMEEKGVAVLLEAWRLLGDAHRDATLVVVGFGEQRASFEALAPQRTIFTGPMTHDQLACLLPLADAAAVPSVLSEAFGMVAAEQAACGVIPVVSNHSGLAEVAEGLGEAGRTFDGSPGDLASQLDRLLCMSVADRRRLGGIARQAVIDQWSWPSLADRLVAHTLAGQA
jgi:glycosyltransferase involved in cell wall biosynthesis